MTTATAVPVRSHQQQDMLLDIIRHTFGWTHVALLGAGMRGPNRVAVQFASQQGSAYLLGTALLDNIVWSGIRPTADVSRIELTDRKSAADIDFIRLTLDPLD